MSPLEHVVKRALDVVGALLALTATAPLLIVVAVLIRRRLGRPVLFQQERVGLGSRRFVLLKFRTMRKPQPGEKDDSRDEERLTELGRLLRAYSIDELPTLWNVLHGEMSLVGPRPLLVRYLKRYTPEQARRHQVKPGITGWTQIKGRNALSWEEKFKLDTWYVDHQSLLLDLKILVKTVLKVIQREGINQNGYATMPEFWGSQEQNDQRETDIVGKHSEKTDNHGIN